MPRASVLLAVGFLLLAVSVAMTAGCGSTTENGGGGASGDVKLKTLDLAAIKERIASHKGRKIVVVDFWSTSCEPCMKEFPGLVALAEKHPDDVACVSVSVDFVGGKNKKSEDKEAKVLKFLTSLDPPPKRVDNILCGTPSDDVLADESLELGGSVPAVVVYARDGQRTKVFNEGEEFTYADVVKLVDELLATK